MTTFHILIQKPHLGLAATPALGVAIHVGSSLVSATSTAAAAPIPPPLRAIDDIVDEWGRQSFPASDPPSNW